MTTHEYMRAIQVHLSQIAPNPLPVVDGPVDFALNTQAEKSFVCVSEQELEIESYNSDKRYSAHYNILVEIHIERAPADRRNKHLEMARNNFDRVFHSLGGVRVKGFQLMRQSGRRVETDDPAAVVYQIGCILETTEYEPCQ